MSELFKLFEMFELSKLLEPSELLEVFGLPELPEASELPELPEASELPELPEASELPEQFDACCRLLLFLLLRREIYMHISLNMYIPLHKRVSHHGGTLIAESLKSASRYDVCNKLNSLQLFMFDHPMVCFRSRIPLPCW